MAPRDTICALASGSVPSAIALIRVSGPRVEQIVEVLLGRDLEARRATLCVMHDPKGQPIDDVIATVFIGPASFTGEDVLELSLHGGSAVVNAAMGAIIAQPQTRLAEAGEFTRRAVDAGKFDLVEAEAIADLIEADTEEQRKQALRQLRGVTSEKLEDWRRQLLETLALLEVTVDFPDEEDAPDFTYEPVRERLTSLKSQLDSALGDDQVGEQVRDGFRIALIGKPNAGKSSLLNRLAGRDAAIVTDVPGTTRDTVEVRMNIAGYLVILTDTAGLRETDDPIEQEGVRRAKRAAGDADLVLEIVDASDPHEKVEGRDYSGTRTFQVRNKSDLVSSASRNVSRETLHVSAKTGAGVDDLLDRIGQQLGELAARHPSPIITRRRHRVAIETARISIGAALSGMDSGLGTELVAEDARRAAHALSVLLGKIDVEDVLGTIFSSFCIGK